MKKDLLSATLIIFGIFLFFVLTIPASGQIKDKKQLIKQVDQEFSVQKGEKIYKQIVSKKILLSQEKQQNFIKKDMISSQNNVVTIISEGFEGDFPAGLWSVETGNYNWAKRNVTSHNGSNCAWAIGGGTIGNTLSYGSYYPNSLYTAMIYGPFDLSDVNWAALSFYVSLNSESDYDYFSFMASDNGTDFYGYALSGTTNNQWLQFTLALNAIPITSNSYQNYTGNSSVWIAFSFESDGSINFSNGAFLDDVLLQKGMLNVPNIVSSFPAPGGSSRGIAFDGTNLWCSDAVNARIYKISTNGNIISSFASPEYIPTGLAWDGNNLWNADINSTQIYKLSNSGSVLSSFLAPGESPSGLTWDDSNFWLSDAASQTIWKLSSNGSVLSTITATGTYHYGLAWDGQNLWLVDSDALLIYKLDNTGNILDYYLTPATFPTGLAWDGAYFWLTDRDTDLIYKLEIASLSYANDIGVIEMNLPDMIELGDSLFINATIKNFGTSVQSNFPVTYNINNGMSITENFQGSLNPDESAVKIFSNLWKPANEGTYQFNAWTSLTADENRSNDTLPDIKTVTVNRFSKDVGVTAIDLPDIIELGDSVQVKVVIKNYGSPQQNFPVSYNINGSSPVTENFTDELTFDETATKTFSNYWKPAAEGTHQFNAWTSLSGDEDRANDTLPDIKNITVYKTINEPPAFKLYFHPDGIIQDAPYTQESNQDVYVFGYVEWQYPLLGDIIGNSFELNFIGGSQGIDGTQFKAELLIKSGQTETSIATKEFFGSCFYTLPFYDIYPCLMNVMLSGINPTAHSGDILLVRLSVVSGAAGRVMYGTTVGENFIKIPYASAPLLAPTQTSPINNAVNVSINPQLVWTGVNGATLYHLQVSTIADFSTIVLSDSTLTNNTRLVGPLDYYTRYYWRVRAKNNAGASPWSSTFNFRTVGTLPGIPILASPVNNAIDLPVQVNFNWNKVNYSEAYQLQISAEDIFSNLFFNDQNIVDTQKTTNSLEDGMRYFWHVRARNNMGPGNWSETWNFITQMFSPDSLIAISNEDNKVELTWLDKCSCESGYIIERTLESSGSYEILDSVGSNQTNYLDTTVQAGITYKYRLKAYNNFASSAYSNEAVVTAITSVDDKSLIPNDYYLYQNYPNPFNPYTTIRFSIPKTSNISINVYTVLGEKVLIFTEGKYEPGFYEIEFNASNLTNGVYIYSFESEEFTQTRKMIILK